MSGFPAALAGRYQAARRVGQGGFGEVWRAEDQQLGRTVAVKLLLRDRGEEWRARFLREARVTASLDHPHVVPVLDLGSDRGRVWIVYEWIAGGDLASRLRRRPPPRVGQVLEWGAQVADALHTAHRAGILHRDIKPANILLRDEGHACVADFGVARASGDGVRTRTGVFFGTPDYLAPESLDGTELTGAADQFSLGATLLEALGGRPIYGGARLEDMIATLRRPWSPPAPEAFPAAAPVLDRALARDPAARFASMGELAAALRSLAQDLPPPDEPSAPPPAGAPAGGRATSPEPPRATPSLVSTPSWRRGPTTRRRRAPPPRAWWIAGPALALSLALGLAWGTGAGSNASRAPGPTAGSARQGPATDRPAGPGAPAPSQVDPEDLAQLGASTARLRAWFETWDTRAQAAMAEVGAAEDPEVDTARADARFETWHRACLDAPLQTLWSRHLERLARVLVTAGADPERAVARALERATIPLYQVEDRVRNVAFHAQELFLGRRIPPGEVVRARHLEDELHNQAAAFAARVLDAQGASNEWSLRALSILHVLVPPDLLDEVVRRLERDLLPRSGRPAERYDLWILPVLRLLERKTLPCSRAAALLEASRAAYAPCRTVAVPEGLFLRADSMAKLEVEVLDACPTTPADGAVAFEDYARVLGLFPAPRRRGAIRALRGYLLRDDGRRSQRAGTARLLARLDAVEAAP